MRLMNNEQMDITPSQCRGARGLLGISQQDLADASKVSKRTIAAFELGENVRAVLRDAIARALEDAGVQFIPENGGGAGVRLRKPDSAE